MGRGARTKTRYDLDDEPKRARRQRRGNNSGPTVPKLSDFAENLGHYRTPPVKSFGRALRAEYGKLDRQRLAEILLTEPAEITN